MLYLICENWFSLTLHFTFPILQASSLQLFLCMCHRKECLGHLQPCRYVQSNSVCGHNSSHSREVFTELSTWVNPYGWWLHNSIYSIHYFFIICALELFLCSTPFHTLYRFSFQFLKEFRISLPYLLASAQLLSIEKMEAQEILVNGCPENSGF